MIPPRAASGSTGAAPASWISLFGRGFALAVLALVVFHVVGPPQYEFPPPVPFHGDRWYDPYAGDGGVWLRANFHAHGRAWGGLTFGEQDATEVWRRYRDQGYDIYAVSNYQTLASPDAADPGAVPAYEHGFGIGARHQTVIGAKRVSWYEYLLYQGVRQKQAVLDHLRPGSELLVLNHPDRLESYTLEDMVQLTGYDALEVRSKYADADAYWDAALSAGRPVWGFVADDSHDLDRPSNMGIGWLMVRADASTPRAALDAIRAGRFYGVWTRERERPNRLDSFRLRDGEIEVRCADPADAIRFVGQGGTLLASLPATSIATYRMRPEDTYVRTEVVTGTTTLFLNPVFRTTGDPLAHQPARPAPLATWATRAGGLAVLVVAGTLLFRGLPGSRRPTVTGQDRRRETASSGTGRSPRSA